MPHIPEPVHYLTEDIGPGSPSWNCVVASRLGNVWCTGVRTTTTLYEITHTAHGNSAIVAFRAFSFLRRLDFFRMIPFLGQFLDNSSGVHLGGSVYDSLFGTMNAILLCVSVAI